MDGAPPAVSGGAPASFEAAQRVLRSPEEGRGTGARCRPRDATRSLVRGDPATGAEASGASP